MAIQTLNTIKNWFKTGLKPSQNQFWDTWDSFRHKNEKVPFLDVENLETTLNTKENKSNKGIANGYVPLDAFSKIANQYLTIVNDLVSGGSNSLLSAEQGKILQNQINGINNLLKSDNVNLNTLQKIVDTIEEIQNSINIPLINDLTTGGTTKALTAEMGKQLNQIKLSATIATDAETQIASAITEDNKVISRSKLFNWWKWIKSQPQTILGFWNFENLSIGSLGYLTSDSSRLYVRAFKDKQLNIGVEGIPNDAILINSNGVQLTDKISLISGTATKAPLIIPNGTLTTVPQNGAIERDIDGNLWETNSGKRSKLITTADGIILLAYKNFINSQANISGSISATGLAVTNDTVIGNIKNNSILRLNLLNEIYYVNNNPNVGTIEPTLSKTEIYLKINNGLFASHYSGSGAVNQVKIIEYSGLNNNGLKNYQSPFIADIQNSNPLLAQWSSLRFFTQFIKDGISTNGDATYYLRDVSNSRTLGASEASFSFVFVNTVTYADSTNINGQNISKTIRLNNLALYLETIK